MADTLTSRSPGTLPVPLFKSAKLQRRLGRAVLYVLVIGASSIFMIPFVYTILSSLKTAGELFAYPPTWIPATPQPQNYAEVFRRVPFDRWLLNSLLVSVVSTFGAVMSAAIVGYSFARFRYPGRDLLFVITLSTMMLPVEVTLIPLYLGFARLGWLDTYAPLIVPSFFGGGAFF